MTHTNTTSSFPTQSILFSKPMYFQRSGIKFVAFAVHVVQLQFFERVHHLMSVKVVILRKSVSFELMSKKRSSNKVQKVLFIVRSCLSIAKRFSRRVWPNMLWSNRLFQMHNAILVYWTQDNVKIRKHFRRFLLFNNQTFFQTSNIYSKLCIIASISLIFKRNIILIISFSLSLLIL